MYIYIYNTGKIIIFNKFFRHIVARFNEFMIVDIRALVITTKQHDSYNILDNNL